MFKTPKFWESKNLLSLSMLPFSCIYILLTKLRKLFAFPYKATGKVICVGSNIAGGSGKTTIVIEIVKMLKEQYDDEFCIVSYGPGGKLKGPVLVKPHMSIIKTGDEASILSRFAPTIIAKRKNQGIKLADKLGFKYIIIDDGLQNPHFIKDLSICAINTDIKNNGFILPAGPNRECVEDTIAKSDMIILFGDDNLPITDKKTIKAYKKFTPIFSKTKVIAFSAIANCRLFIKALEENGAVITSFYEYPDHHHYSQANLNQIFNSHQNSIYVTTLKDYVKLPKIYQDRVVIFEESLILDNPGMLLDEIISKKS